MDNYPQDQYNSNYPEQQYPQENAPYQGYGNSVPAGQQYGGEQQYDYAQQAQYSGQQQYGYAQQYGASQQQYDYAQQQYDYSQDPYGAYYPIPSAAEPKKEKKPTYLFVLLGILCACLLAVVGICVYIFAFQDNSPSTKKGKDNGTYVQTAPTQATEAPTEAKPAPTQPAPTETQPQYLDLHLTRNYIDFKVPLSGFVIEDSDTRVISESELYSMTEHQVCVARNEIFARHGRKFKDENLAEYFNALDWYYGHIEPADFDRDLDYYLNSIEKQNIKTIVAYETKKGW